MNEFDFIRNHLAPLSGDGSFGLTDDIAQLYVSDGKQVVFSIDNFVEGLHFPDGWGPQYVLPRLLRCAVSDVIAKGATPLGYGLSLAFPKHYTDLKKAELVKGLAKAQASLGLKLLGGDTTGSGDKLHLSLTVFGETRAPILRSGAKAGQDVWVTGTIGDAYLCRIFGYESVPNVWKRAYFNPPIPLKFSQYLENFASASADVSDGLLADLRHIANASQVTINVESDMVPLSDASKSWGQTHEKERLFSAGDDYQIVFTADKSSVDLILEAGVKSRTQVNRIGSVIRSTHSEPCVLLDSQPLSESSGGYKHF